MELTDNDREVIAQAARLADAKSDHEIAREVGRGSAASYSELIGAAFAKSQLLLAHLVSIIEQNR